MHYEYKPTGVCASKISFDIENNKVTNIQFIGGCPGYSHIFAKAINGWTKEEIIQLCQGNCCGQKQTSCADQLAKALNECK